ncbi:rhomboid family intramembrane serine protease [Chondromyces apiculatus]|uniref:Peptidase S54 rhomboid domain-containing protein n=1 Tax=Chondromyces apiculatus DSM 436 TaxID=1192034 RepID=A0A017TH43_9BACT|nr:rhomboid family intramembrane serine protease [Chondromyces apiculatus]EYF08578.1 Hypothetical protein CAP_4108 [Chondromyces apiculatus DSM 436]
MEPFASYLARHHIVERGFTPSAPIEAEPLARACDILLTYSDGMSFGMVCIVDAEDDDDRCWPEDFGQDRLIEIGKTCLKYTGHMNGTKLPVGIQIIEIRKSITDDDHARLKPLHRLPGLAKVGITALVAAPSTAEAWSSTAIQFFATRRLRALMKGPREDLTLTPAALAPDASADASADAQKPLLTYAILGTLGLVFLGQLAFAVPVGPPGSASAAATAQGLLGSSVPTLIALGGLSQPLATGAGEWHRLLTATLLHGDLFHLALNGVALYIGGAMLELFVGRAWLLPLLLVGALGGSFASLAWNADAAISVGASGAIMGLLASALVSTLRLPPRERSQATIPLVQMLVPSLIPLAVHRTAGKVDFAAHLGGAIAGALAGALLLAIWPKTRPHPRFQNAALGVSIACVLLYAGALYQAAELRPTYEAALTAAIIPSDDLPTIESRSTETLLSTYPHDPRTHFLAASRAATSGDLPTAEQHLRRGLDERGVLQVYFPDRQLEARMRALLATVLSEQGRPNDAAEAARPVCDVNLPTLAPFCR